MTVEHPPRLFSCYFRGDAGEQFPRLARVLEHTAREHCQGWTIDVRAITPPPAPAADGTAAYEHNTQKLDAWARLVWELPDGAQVLLIDTDTQILRPLDAVWEQPFDIAITRRPATCKLPFNAGVVFARGSAASRAFMLRWRDENRRMLTDMVYHRPWRRRFGGINQAALGCTLETIDRSTIAIAELPCREWNCEDSTWSQFDPAVSRILHIKSALRQQLFLLRPSIADLRPLVTQWRRIERAVVDGAAVVAT
jgi:hypothetical protein